VDQPFFSTILPFARRAIAALSLGCLAVNFGAAPVTAQQNDARSQLAPLFEDQAKVSVRVKSGRTFTGHVDARTDATTLWLRFEDDRATLWRPIAWQRVQSASAGEKNYSAEELRGVATRLGTTEAAARREWPARQSNSHTSATTSIETVAESSTVRALSLDVRFANWDADRDDDGLIAAITPIDDAGRPVAASGTLSVELIGMTAPRTVDYAGIAVAHEQERPTLETWTVQLAPNDFLDGTAQVRLPFRNGEPADDPRLQNFGVLRARLTVPGSDVVEAELDPIRLRSTVKVGSGRD
jgi:hypothetical protein